MKKLTASLILVVTLAGFSVLAASSAELLEKGIYLEETKGDLDAAREVYQRIIDDPGASRSIAAQAQLRLGTCELKLGNKQKAISALDRLTQQFPDRDQLLALVDNQIPALLDEMIRQIEQNYILEVDRSELLDTALRAIVGKLDTRSAFGLLRTNDMEYLGTNELGQINEEIGQQIVGIGALLRTEKGEAIVASPMRRSPAINAGIKPGDRIIRIDGKDVPTMLASTVKALRGPAGSTVGVTVARPGVDDPLHFEVTRAPILLESVKGARYRPDDTWDFMLDDQRKIGYARLTQIGKRTPNELQAALKDLHSRGMTALILDLRNNPGGTLAEAIAVADFFIEEGAIVTVKGRSDEKVYTAKAENTYSGFPMAVLVNRSTASAAEVIAGCLQDHQRATVVGERTFGQAIVRSLLPLKTGGALKLPVAAYYRPSGKHVNRFPGATETDDWGIKPDHGVVISDDEVARLLVAWSARESLDPKDAPNAAFDDRQLQKALECLR